MIVYYVNGEFLKIVFRNRWVNFFFVNGTHIYTRKKVQKNHKTLYGFLCMYFDFHFVWWLGKCWKLPV